MRKCCIVLHLHYGRHGVGRGVWKEKKWSKTVIIEEEIKRMELGKKRLSSRKLKDYEDYRSDNITKDKYCKEYESADSRILEIEKRIPELKDEIIQVRE